MYTLIKNGNDENIAKRHQGEYVASNVLIHVFGGGISFCIEAAAIPAGRECPFSLYTSNGSEQLLAVTHAKVLEQTFDFYEGK